MSAEAARTLPAGRRAAPRLRLYRPAGRATPPARSLAAVGWAWRVLAGAALCFNAFLLSYATSVVVFGWFYRWMQAVAVRGWWRRSPLRGSVSYAEFCRSLGADGPADRPRLFAHDQFWAHVSRPAADGRRPGPLRLAGRCLSGGVHSLWLNVRAGLRGLCATYLLTSPGCLLMLLGWEFGWLNSFVKGYESAWLGPAACDAGVLLLAAALCYVPMAQAHQATAGDFRAFFEFRVVCRLIRARLGHYTLLALLTWLVSLPLEVLKTLPGYFDQQYPFAIRQLIEHQVSPGLTRFFVTLNPGLAEAGGAEVVWVLTWYFLKCAVVLFACLLLIRWAAARVYSSAVLEALRRGLLGRDELHPRVRGYLDRLEVHVVPAPPQPWSFRQLLRSAVRRAGGLALGVVLVVCWLSFAGKVFASEFYTYHPFVGFMNHPLVQFPCFDYMPPGLFWEQPYP